MTAVLLVLVVIGFVAAAFANPSDPRWRTSVARGVLLASTISVVGVIACDFDRGLMRPYSWAAAMALVLVGLALCSYVFLVRRFIAGLVCGAVLIVAVPSLHLFARGASGLCQRACAGLRKGMSPEDVKASVLMRLPQSDKYHVVISEGSLPPDGMGGFTFLLLPGYADVDRETIGVLFNKGHFIGAWSSAVRLPIYFSTPLPFAAVGLLVACALRLRRRELDVFPENVAARLKRARTDTFDRHVPQKGGRIYRLGLVRSAGKRLRGLAFFRERDHEAAEAPDREAR